MTTINQKIRTLTQAGQIVESVRDFCEHFSLDGSSEILVGASGGKDSLLLALVLRQMGIRVIPVVIDLGYANFRGREIAAYIESLGFRTHLINASEHLRRRGDERTIAALTVLNGPHESGFVPCTDCSSIKRRLLLDAAYLTGARYIALGHHFHDFLATLFKDYFVHHYSSIHGEFKPEAFETFVRAFEIDHDRLTEMVEKGVASTMAAVLPGPVPVVRPLAFVSEFDIIRCVGKNHLITFGSGCAHSAFEMESPSPTKREVVHAELLRRESLGKLSLTTLRRVILQCLDSSGKARFNPRKHRSKNYPHFEICPGIQNCGSL